ncbi:unnamed protein product, partial [Vitis vinifera]|uniref:Uncharacterized protein n=1 Tax=Vitis vinifera TaxID=29760 RepID=D7TQA9_VITVI
MFYYVYSLQYFCSHHSSYLLLMKMRQTYTTTL